MGTSRFLARPFSVGEPFLYKGDEPGSARLRRALGDVAIVHGARFWSDERTTDAGFAAELRRELGQSDAIVHSVGPKGLGDYQRMNEIDATIDALRSDSNRRLLVVLLGGAEAPPDFARFNEFGSRRQVLELDERDPNAVDVLRAALPDAMPQPEAPEGRRAAEVIAKTITAVRPKSLTIVVGPYASAEINEPSATPASAIRQLLQNRSLPGSAPWLDVMGSIVRAGEKDDETAAVAVQRALGETATSGAGTLGVYLRLLAANWVRRESASRLIIISCSPDLRLDLALRSSQMPVPHVRLVHCSRAQDRLLIERIAVDNLRTACRARPQLIPSGRRTG